MKCTSHHFIKNRNTQTQYLFMRHKVDMCYYANVYVPILIQSECWIIITKHSSALYIGMAKVLPIIDVLGYDGQNSSFFFFSSFSSSSFRFDTHNSKTKSYINMKLCGYVGFHNAKRLVILTCL